MIEGIIAENLQQIVTNQFSRVAHNDRFSYIGNVTLGSSISLSELRDLYHVVRHTLYEHIFEGSILLYDICSC